MQDGCRYYDLRCS